MGFTRTIRGSNAHLITLALLIGGNLMVNVAIADTDPKLAAGTAPTGIVRAPKAGTLLPGDESKPTHYIPLDIAVSMNGKYAGQIDAKIDPATGNGQVKTDRFLGMMKPILGKGAYEQLSDALSESDNFADFGAITRGGLIAEFDNLSLTLVITSSGSDLGSKKLSFRTSSSAPNPELYPAASNFTAGLNINASQVRESRDGLSQNPDTQVTLNSLVNIGGFEGLTIEGGARYSSRNSDPWQRTPIIASKDYYDSALRVTAGEISPRLQGFQGSRRMLGVGLFRSYSAIRPFQTVRPTGRSEFSLDEESTVEVYVNNILQETIDLQTGSYSLADFPIGSEANDVRLEIVSRSGNSEVLEFDVYGGSELLAPGITDYGVFIGKPQSLNEFEYNNDIAVTAYGRRGFTGQLSLGATGQFTDVAQQVGALLTHGSRWGLIEFATALSRRAEDDELGGAMRLDYRKNFSLFTANDLRISANSEYRSEYFQHAFESIIEAPLEWSARMQASWSGLDGLNATLGFSSVQSRGLRENRVDTVNLSLAKSLGDLRVGGTVTLSDSTFNGSSERFSVTVGYRPRGTVSSSAQYNSSQDQTTIDLRRRSKHLVEGYNGSLQVQSGERGKRLRATGSYAHNRFDTAIQHSYEPKNINNQDSESRTQVRVSTFIGMSGSEVGIGRPIRSAFVLAPRHRSLRKSNVEIRAGRQFVARPGFLGAAVIPLDRPYTVNRFDLVVDPLPIGYDLGSGGIEVFPGHGSSFRLPIGSDASHTAMGFLFDKNGPMELVSGIVSPIGAIKNKEKWERPLFTNRGGRFVADRLRTGRYEIIIDGRVVGEFEVDKDSEGLVNVGKLVEGESK